ncbi:MAG TPA: amidohydrolase family protein [Cyclobacteriaceae bacterium]
MRNLLPLIIVLLLWSCGPKKEKADFINRSGSVIDIATGDIQSKNIVIRGDSVLALIDDEDTIKYEAQQVISAKGKFIIPGLWDMHVHFGGGDTLIQENKDLLPLYVANGITAVRDAAADLSTSVLQWREEINQGKLLGPTLFTSGPKLEGIKSVWIGDLEVGTIDSMKLAMDSLQKMKVDFIKITDNTMKPEIYLEAIREAKRRGLKISGHIPFVLQLEEVSEAGLSSVEHLNYFNKAGSTKDKELSEQVKAGKLTAREAGPIVLESFDSAYAMGVYQRIAKNGTAAVPTLTISKTLAYLDEDDHSHDDYAKYVGKGLKKTYEGRVIRAATDDAKAITNRHNQYKKASSLLPLLQKAGVTIIAGTDAGYLNSFVYPGLALHQELELFVINGLTPLQALQSSIINGPEFLGKSKRYGAISPGKYADITILDQNPLEDIKATRSIQSVILKGKYFDRSALDQLLSEAEKKASN